MAIIVKHLGQAKQLLAKICKENNIDPTNVVVNRDHKYIETIDHSKKDADFCTTTHQGIKYGIRYFDGCFNPYICALNLN
jgi:hypothetical protein